MPITQNRVMSILTAAKDYQLGLRQAIRAVQGTNPASPDEAWAAIARLKALIYESGLLKQPITSAITLATEDQHFTKTAAFNNRRREKQRRKREGMGLEITTAPNEIYTPKMPTGQSNFEELEPKLSDADALLNQSFSNISPETVAAIDKQIEAEARAEAWLARRNKPPVIGPSNAPGLYDEDEGEDAGPLVENDGV